MGTELLIIVGLFMFLVFMQLIWASSRYIKCPPDKIMVVFGKISPDPDENYKVLTSGAAFVWPIIQKYAFINASPEEISILREFQTKDNQQISGRINLICKVSKNHNSAVKAAELFYKKNKEEILEIIKYKLSNQIGNEVSKHPATELNLNMSEIRGKIENLIKDSLTELGMELIAIKEFELNLK